MDWYVEKNLLINNQTFLIIYVSLQAEGKTVGKRTSAGIIRGELKLSLEYRKDALLVMVHHAKDLAMPDGSKEAPNSFVKVRIQII